MITRKTGNFGQAVPVSGEVSTEVPARAANVVADLVVPLGQSIVTGGLLSGLFVVVLGEVVPDFDGDLVKLWAVLGLAVAAVAWLVLLGQTRRLLWSVEKWTGVDVDGDNQVGQPQPPPQERVVIVNAGQGQQEAVARENHERASQFASFVSRLAVKGTAARAWESEVGREVYQDYRDALIRLGWARWRSVRAGGQPNENKGWVLTLPVEDILGKIG